MINKELLNDMIDQGHVSVNKHPECDLYIYTYTNKCQYEQMWNEVTTQTRGLILDADYNIVARPFKKFFNLSEHKPEEIPNLPFEVFEKMDGSLGILFWNPYLEKFEIATKGSFTSDQAVKANKILNTKYKNEAPLLNKRFTYLFEIIYKNNQIVVDYGNIEDIFLLSIIDTKDNSEFSYNQFINGSPFPIVNRYDGITDINTLKQLEESNKEGFVVKFENGFRVKVKFDEYIRLHRIITMVSNKVIWESLKYGNDLPLDRVPDEFYEWVKNTKKSLQIQFMDIKYEVSKAFKNVCEEIDLPFPYNKRKGVDVKEFVLKAKKHKLAPLIIAKFATKDFDRYIWDMIEPKFEKPYTDEC